MTKKLFLHNYDKCLVNLTNSVLDHFGIRPEGGTLLLADRFLKKNYKNVVVLLLDGLGTCILKEHASENGFLREHFIESIHSVFPPTTVAATTSVLSGMQPIEHAWLGWDCYYPQIDKNVTVFLNTEQGTDKPASEVNVAWKYCGYKSVVEKLNESGKKAYTVSPYAPPFFQSFDEICSQIVKLSEEDGEKYIYAYWVQPDSVMHDCGCKSKEAREEISALEKKIKDMSEKLDDTLLIITADHGHIDGKNAVLADYPAIMECLVRLPSIEPRALNLYVKEDKKEQFEREFRKEFGEYYILLSKEELYKAQLFGTGTPHENADAMIGDYIALAVTELTIFNTKEAADELVGVHAGYTKEEMEIPIIVYESKRTMAEIWDAYDEHFQKIDHVSLVRGEPVPDGMYHLVSEIIVKHKDGTYLLMQRDLRKHLGGMWELTAGGSALSGESPMDCALRELREETGIDSDSLTEVGRIVHKAHHSLYVEYICCTDCDKDAIVLQEGETIAYRWVDEQTVLNMKNELASPRAIEVLNSLKSKVSCCAESFPML